MSWRLAVVVVVDDDDDDEGFGAFGLDEVSPTGAAASPARDDDDDTDVRVRDMADVWIDAVRGVGDLCF